MAKGGHSIAIGHSDPDDNVTLYYEDIFEGSYQIGNRRLIDVVAEESISRTLELDEWGLGLVKLDDGRYEQKYGGYCYSRLHNKRRTFSRNEGSIRL